MLVESHSAEIAFEAVESRFLIFLLLEDRVVELSVGKPCLCLALILFNRCEKGLICLVNFSLGEVMLTDDAM